MKPVSKPSPTKVALGLETCLETNCSKFKLEAQTKAKTQIGSISQTWT